MMSNMKGSRDFHLAYELHKEINSFGVTENAILPKTKDKENYKPRTLIDQTLELIDPTPNIHTLFVQFNERFFYNTLLPVEVKWSNRMTSCAGICTFHPRNRQCVITISAPLLKLRPRKDLVETLLHEMIHGYLFLTNNNRDRDGHGPEFCKHMNRINKEAGTHITIYHSFHDEVRLYQQHWWRCNGPCQKRAPYFGTVRRAMNRAPGPSDFWWKEHQQTCGGEFIKIREPENFKSKKGQDKEKDKKSGSKTAGAGSNKFLSWLTKTSTPVSASKSIERTPKSVDGFKKLGNNTQVTSGASNTGTPTTGVSNMRIQSYSGTLGGSNTGRSNLLDKFDRATNCNGKLSGNSKTPKNTMESWVNSVNSKSGINNKKVDNEANLKLVQCPVCDDFVTADVLNKHVDVCFSTSAKTTQGIWKTNNHNNGTVKSQMISGNSTHGQKRSIDIDANSLLSKHPKVDHSENSKEACCPVCNKRCQLSDINEHLDKCLTETSGKDYASTVELNNSNSSNCLNQSAISISSTSSSDSSPSWITEHPRASPTTFDSQKKGESNINVHKCLVCNAVITPDISLNDHLEDCVGSVFNDDSTLLPDFKNEEKTGTSSAESDIYPCPVCMELISESRMNQHLDTCLKNA